MIRRKLQRILCALSSHVRPEKPHYQNEWVRVYACPVCHELYAVMSIKFYLMQDREYAAIIEDKMAAAIANQFLEEMDQTLRAEGSGE